MNVATTDHDKDIYLRLVEHGCTTVHKIPDSLRYICEFWDSRMKLMMSNLNPRWPHDDVALSGLMVERAKPLRSFPDGSRIDVVEWVLHSAEEQEAEFGEVVTSARLAVRLTNGDVFATKDHVLIRQFMSYLAKHKECSVETPMTFTLGEPRGRSCVVHVV